MFKKTLLTALIVLSLLISISLFSTPVTSSMVENTVNTFLQVKDKVSDFAIGKIEQLKSDDQKTVLAYIVNLNPKGFVVISVDTDIYPVIAYSFIGNFVMEDVPQNIGYQMVKTDMDLRLKAIPQTSDNLKNENNSLWNKYLKGDIFQIKGGKFEQWPPEGSTPTEGWVLTTWNQGGPYNSFCPMDPQNGGRSVTGCVATAMSQVLNYHKYIGNANFTDADDYWSTYTNPAILIDDDYLLRDFPSFPELNVYLDTLKSHYLNNVYLTNEDKAALNFAAGISVHMSYSNNASGAYMSDVDNAFIYKFNYDSANYYDYWYPNFYTILQTDMQNARPAILGVVSAEEGHAIIIDGYNTDDYYHCNFGWGGDWDGWYSLPYGLPAGFYAVSHGVMNIEGGLEVDVDGTVSVDETSPVGTEITFDGGYDYSATVTDPTGYYELPQVMPGPYTASALLVSNDSLFYQSKEVYISEFTSTVNFDLFYYEKVSGTVSIDTVGVSPVGTIIEFDGDYHYSTTVSDPSGYYEIPSVMPGTYTATAALGRMYFQTKEVVLDSINMQVDFELGNYSNQVELHYDSTPSEIFVLPTGYTAKSAVRFTPDELDSYVDDLIAQVKFKAPASSDDCDITIKIWECPLDNLPEDNYLVYEQEIDNFNADEWVIHILDVPIPIMEDTEYWLGYEIHAINTGNIVWIDEGPMVPDKGGWLYISAWMPFTQIGSNDNNFNIRAIILTPGGGTEPRYIPLYEDWNWISFNVHPNDTSLYSVFASVMPDDIYQVKNQLHSATNYSGTWVGDLTDIADGEGYLVNMNESAPDYSILGMPILYNVPITLTANWNWIAFYPNVIVPIGPALQSITDDNNAIQIKNQTQSATWYGTWVGDLTVMEPGVGYKLNMNSDDQLIYYISKNVHNVKKHTSTWKVISGTQYNMVAIVKLGDTNYELGSNPLKAENYELGVFDNDDNCRSIGVRQNLNGNDFWYFTIVGNETAETKEELHFRVYNEKTNEMYECNEKILFADNTTIGSPDEPFVLTADNKSNIPMVYKLAQNYPNPFNPTTKISYSIPKDTNVELKIYNIKGELVKTLVNEKNSAGLYDVIWNGKDDGNREVSSGIYFYKIQTDRYSETKKMLLLR